MSYHTNGTAKVPKHRCNPVLSSLVKLLVLHVLSYLLWLIRLHWVQRKRVEWFYSLYLTFPKSLFETTLFLELVYILPILYCHPRFQVSLFNNSYLVTNLHSTETHINLSSYKK